MTARKPASANYSISAPMSFAAHEDRCDSSCEIHGIVTAYGADR